MKTLLRLLLVGLVLPWIPSACRGPGKSAGPAHVEGDPLERLLEVESARVESDVLQTLLQHPEEGIRERAAFAIGRLPEPRRALVHALGRTFREDESEAVRNAAAFAMGYVATHWSDLHGEPRTEPDEPRLCSSTRIEISPAALEAQSRIGPFDDLSLNVMLRALNKLRDDLRIQLELVGVMHRLPEKPEIDEILATRLLEVASTPQQSPEMELVWRALFSLQRRNIVRAGKDLELSSAGRDAFLRWSDSTVLDPRARIYAVRGLKTLPADEAVLVALMAAASDEDWRVVVEAVQGLGVHGAPNTLSVVLAATGHDSAHVRRVAFDALAVFADGVRFFRQRLEQAVLDESSSVQGAAIVTSAKVFGDEYVPRLHLHRLRRDPIVRAAVAEAARNLSSEVAVPLLDRLARDETLRVAGTALASLGAHDTDAARSILYRYLGHADRGLRSMALGALSEAPREADFVHVQRAFLGMQGRNGIDEEFRASALRMTRGFDSEAARKIRAEALWDRCDHVFRIASELHPQGPVERKTVCELGTLEKTEVPGGLLARIRAPKNPFVEIETTRGTMLFELFPKETPFHVHNFVTLAERNHYDGLSFHRVVPNFVIQGGDERGDGNGQVTWNNLPLRAEFTPRKFVRGSLGMPRNDDPDSGGSQIFVTHRATPHLDTRYTIFGELRDGFDVLDRIEVGDRILDVRVVPTQPSAP